MSTQPQIDFAIITTLPIEAKAIVKRLQEHQSKRFEEKDIRTYHIGTVPIEGTSQSYRVVVVVLPNMGETQAAIAVTDTIVQWNPRFVFLLGIAGGLPQDDLFLGDVVIADQIIGYEYSKETDRGLQPRERVYPASPLLLDAIRNFWEDDWADNIGLAMPTKARRKKPKLFTGPIASGNKVITSTEFRNALLSRWPKLIAVEMEAEGFYAAMLSRPHIAGALVIRGISDMADKRKSDQWQEYAANAVAAFVIGFLKTKPFEPVRVTNTPAPENNNFAHILAGFANGQTDLGELVIQVENQGFSARYALLEEMISFLFKEGYSLDYDASQPTKLIIGNHDPSEPRLESSQLKKLTDEITRLREAITGHDPDENELSGLAARYRQHIIRWFGRLTFQGMMRTAQVISLPLEDLYVDLHAVAEVPEAADTFSVEERRLLLELKEGDEPFRQELLRQFDALRKDRWSRSKLERKSIIEALYSREQRAFVVLGDPGSGKSTLLHFLAVVFARGPQDVVDRLHLPFSEANRLPIFIPLAAFDDMRRSQPGLSLLNFLGQYYDHRRGLPGLGSLFRHALETGQALVLMDGLDEILDPATRQYVASQAAALIDEYCPRGVRFVLTSRFVGYREAPVGRDLPHLSVIDFGDPEIKIFIHQWANVYEAFVAGGFETPETMRKAREVESDLLKDVNSIESVRRLAANPLMLTMLALLRRQVGRLPHRRIELYQRYMSTMLENWVQMRSEGAHEHTLDLLDPHKAESMLIPLAYWLQSERPSGTASGKDIEEALVEINLRDAGIDPLNASFSQRNEALLQVRRFLHEMRHMNGLIVERGYDAYGFLHLTFQEFFAGRALAQMDPSERQKALKRYIHDPRWREPILLCAGQLGIIEKRRAQVTEYVSQILACPDETELDLHRNLLLALSVAGDDVNLDPGLLDILLRRALECFPTKIYILAEEIILRLGQLIANHSIQAESYLIQVLNFDDGELRWRVVQTLGKFILEVSIRQALLGKLDDPDHNVRAIVVEALAPLIGNDENLRQVLLGMLDDPDYFVRAAVLEALAPLVGNDATLRQVLLGKLDDPVYNVRAAVVRALAPLAGNDETLRQVLLGKLDDPDYDGLAVVVRALAPLVGNDENLCQVLLGKLDDPDYDVRISVVEALAPLVGNDENLRQVLLGKLDDPDYDGRDAVVEALAPQVGNDETLRQILLGKLDDPDNDVRAAVVRVLAPLVSNDETLRQVLLGKLDDPDDGVCAAVVKALAPLVGNDAIIFRVLESHLFNPNWRLRRVIIQILSECLADKPLIPHLLPLLFKVSCDLTAHESSKFTSRIILALTNFNLIPDVRQALLDKLDDPDDGVRVAVVRALAPLVGNDATLRQTLLGKLDDPDYYVRAAVVRALAPLVGNDATLRQTLLGKLDDPDYDGRAAVVMALAPLAGNDETLRQVLLGKLDDPRYFMSAAVVRALAPLVGNDVTLRQVLLGKLDDPDNDVREVVVRAMTPLVGNDATLRQVLLVKLDDPVHNVRRAVVETLAPLVGNDEALRQVLLGKLDDPDYDVRTVVVEALASLVSNDETLRQVLLGKLDDPDNDVRVAVVRALAPLVGNDETIRQVLLGKLEDPDDGVRVAVVEAMAPLVGNDATLHQVLSGKLDDPDNDVRAAVVRALAPLVGNDETIRQILLGKLDDSMWIVRASAAKIVLRNFVEFPNFGKGSQSEKLFEWLYQDVDERYVISRFYRDRELNNELVDQCAVLMSSRLTESSEIRNRLLTGLANPRGSIRQGSALALLAWPGSIPPEFLLQVLKSLENKNELASYPARLEAAGFLINRDPYSSDAISLCLEALEYGTKPWENLPRSMIIREQAAGILGKLEMTFYDEKVYEKLSQVMREDLSGEVRDAAYGSLLRLARLRPVCGELSE